MTTTFSELEDPIKKVDELLEEGKLHVKMHEGQRDLVNHYVAIEKQEIKDKVNHGEILVVLTMDMA